ncbi:hypothetical protein ACJJTC_015844, partial [Scirpophaga incertulas]
IFEAIGKRMWKLTAIITIAIYVCHVHAKITTDEDTGDSEVNTDLDDLDSTERVGPMVTQIVQHPYSGSLFNNGSYVCSCVVLNKHWLLTSSKCFKKDVISSYVTYKKLGNYTVRVGSSYNNKGGSMFEIKMLINNFDMTVSAIKLKTAMEFGSRVNAVRIPAADDDVILGYLASVVAWTPSGHIRVVNAPVIAQSLCESYTKMLAGNFICIGGVQDPDRHFCRRDNGGAVIQNNMLVGIATFIHTCAVYNKIHAFPKVATFSRWLNSVIWDEETRPTAETTETQRVPLTNATATPLPTQTFVDPRKILLKLPFDPIGVPLEPAENNSVVPRISLYEAYLQSLERAKTSTTQSPKQLELKKKAWMQQFGKAMMTMPQQFGKKYNAYDFSSYNL